MGHLHGRLNDLMFQLQNLLNEIKILIGIPLQIPLPHMLNIVQRRFLQKKLQRDVLQEHRIGQIHEHNVHSLHYDGNVGVASAGKAPAIGRRFNYLRLTVFCSHHYAVQ